MPDSEGSRQRVCTIEFQRADREFALKQMDGMREFQDPGGCRISIKGDERVLIPGSLMVTSAYLSNEYDQDIRIGRHSDIIRMMYPHDATCKKTQMVMPEWMLQAERIHGKKSELR